MISLKVLRPYSGKEKSVPDPAVINGLITRRLIIEIKINKPK